MRRFPQAVAAVSLAAFAAHVGAQSPAAPTAELDGLMRQVLERRDDNWKKIQQYVLDEAERVEVRGPGETLLWGAHREYVWYPRDGFLVRSPVRFNGVAIGERDRENYEQRFLKRTKDREARDRELETTSGPPPENLQGLIRQTREPQFVTSAYLLQFKFEGGQYAFVGPETIDNHEVLRIEYYPTKLFADDPSTRAEARANQAARGRSKSEAYGREVQRLMNKNSMVTIWVEPAQKQIVRYEFDNVAFDFLPASWLVRVTDLRATMAMSEPFAGVWLPKRLEVSGGFVLAPGRFSVTYDVQYSGYREAATAGKYLGPSR